MDADPKRQPGPQGWEAQGGVLGQALLQVERGEPGAPGMILLGHGRPKHGREAFARR